MTNRDIKMIATALRTQLHTEVDIHGENSFTAGGVRVAASRIAHSIKNIRPGFDQDLFMKYVKSEIDPEDYLPNRN